VEFKVNPDGTGFEVIEHPENWNVLADFSDKDLKAIGLTKTQVEKHTGTGTPPTGATVTATASDKTGSKDKSA
jgi:hypothetical protein